MLTCYVCFVDNVPFGEVAMAPPSLSTKPKKAEVKSQVTCYAVVARHAGFLNAWVGGLLYVFPSASVNQKESKKLLLNSLLGHTMASTSKPSMARQRLIEEERERAVQAYRHLKKQKQQQHEARTASVEKLKNLQWSKNSKSAVSSDIKIIRQTSARGHSVR